MEITYAQAVMELVGIDNFQGGSTHGPISDIKIKDGVTPPTEQAIQVKITELKNAEPMRVLREERNRKLTETDWWCASDRTPTQAQLDYRKALRDLPSTAKPKLDENGQLTNVTWPTKPEN